ncbi:MAG: hypothetical protein ABI045_00165 [Flavobacteriales bacterium]
MDYTFGEQAFEAMDKLLKLYREDNSLPSVTHKVDLHHGKVRNFDW